MSSKHGVRRFDALVAAASLANEVRMMMGAQSKDMVPSLQQISADASSSETETVEPDARAPASAESSRLWSDGVVDAAETMATCSCVTDARVQIEHAMTTRATAELATEMRKFLPSNAATAQIAKCGCGQDGSADELYALERARFLSGSQNPMHGSCIWQGERRRRRWCAGMLVASCAPKRLSRPRCGSSRTTSSESRGGHEPAGATIIIEDEDIDKGSSEASLEEQEHMEAEEDLHVPVLPLRRKQRRWRSAAFRQSLGRSPSASLTRNCRRDGEPPFKRLRRLGAQRAHPDPRVTSMRTTPSEVPAGATSLQKDPLERVEPAVDACLPQVCFEVARTEQADTASPPCANSQADLRCCASPDAHDDAARSSRWKRRRGFLSHTIASRATIPYPARPRSSCGTTDANKLATMGVENACARAARPSKLRRGSLPQGYLASIVGNAQLPGWSARLVLLLGGGALTARPLACTSRQTAWSLLRDAVQLAAELRPIAQALACASAWGDQEENDFGPVKESASMLAALAGLEIGACNAGDEAASRSSAAPDASRVLAVTQRAPSRPRRLTRDRAMDVLRDSEANVEQARVRRVGCLLQGLARRARSLSRRLPMPAW